jgi:RNA polymerase sigma-32 factor
MGVFMIRNFLKKKGQNVPLSKEASFTPHEETKEALGKHLEEPSSPISSILTQNEKIQESSHEPSIIYTPDVLLGEDEALIPSYQPTDEPVDITHEEEKSLVRISGLQLYLREIKKYPLLTREEEYKTAVEAYEHHNVEAKNRLITSNLRLVVKITMEYRRAYAQLLDLIQEGNAGLVQAVNRFNPYKGVKLSTYSAWWIKAYILKFLMDNKSLVRIGTTDAQRKLFFRLKSEAEKLYAINQRFDAKLLAEKIGVEESEVVEMQQRLSKQDLSLNTPIGDKGEDTKISLLQSLEESALNVLEHKEVIKILKKAIPEVEKDLNERDKFILNSRILSEEPITLQEVGDKYNVTRERARQLEARIVEKIKDQFKSLTSKQKKNNS